MELTTYPLLAVMSEDGRFAMKLAASIFLVFTLPAGVYFFKNQHRWFGHAPEVPSDTSGGREYGRMQTWVLYWGLLAVFAFFAFAL